MGLAQGIIDSTAVYESASAENTAALAALTSALVRPTPQVMQIPETLPVQIPLVSAAENLAETQTIQTAVAEGIMQGVQQASPQTDVSPPPANTSAGVVIENITVIVQLDDRSLSQVEGRLATRADQGLSPLNV